LRGRETVRNGGGNLIGRRMKKEKNQIKEKTGVKWIEGETKEDYALKWRGQGYDLF